MKKLILIFSFLTTASSASIAQIARFTRTGIIEYQKTVNMYAIIQRGINENKGDAGLLKAAFESYKQRYPQFKQLQSTLTFAGNQTLFTPTGNDLTTANFFNDPEIALQNNVVYTDLDTKKLVSKRKVFADSYLLKDSLKDIKWKVTDETRDIAGYACHRANGLVLDSIYVVAFYTDDIPVSGGPELFGGLPGMILQIALPHENVSWVAVKVIDKIVPANVVIPPAGGTTINFKGLTEKLRNVFKSNGQNWQRDLTAFLL